MKERVPDAASEKRLEKLREEAARGGTVSARGIRPPGAPFPPAPSAENGYYALPLLKEPVWTWEIPAYFFVGGAAGTAAFVALAAQMTGADRTLVRDGRWIAAIGANVSTVLLISDLGRPERFLNMLRIFKPQSPMSVGAWTLAVFGGAATAAAVAERFSSRERGVISAAGDVAAFVAAGSGLLLATYTGVLIGATSIPVWSRHAGVLPAHFGASGLASAVALLELGGHSEAALNVLGILAAAFETYTGSTIEVEPHVADEPLRHGTTGALTRLGGALSGPLPLLLRIVGMRSTRMRRVAALAALAGSLVTRFAWLDAGRVSARDPRTAVGLEPRREGSA